MMYSDDDQLFFLFSVGAEEPDSLNHSGHNFHGIPHRSVQTKATQASPTLRLCLQDTTPRSPFS